jgi:putative membrane protein
MSTTSRTTRLVNLSLLALAAVTWLGACAKKDASNSDSARRADSAAAASTMSAPPAADTAKPAATATLNDAQIAHVAVTANSLDSAAGVMAKQKGTAKSVKDFAQTMINDHAAVNKQAVALAKKLKVTPEDNDVSKSLKSDADASTSNLQGKSGADFDKAYIDHEVTYHQTVLDALDKTLIPGAQNAELKALLTKVRPSIAAHLARAKDIQTSLNK